MFINTAQNGPQHMKPFHSEEKQQPEQEQNCSRDPDRAEYEQLLFDSDMDFLLT